MYNEEIKTNKMITISTNLTVQDDINRQDEFYKIANERNKNQ